MKSLFFVALVIFAGWFVFHDRPAHWRGMPAPQEPVQTARDLPGAFHSGPYTIKPLATYAITAVVLSRDRYRNDRGAELAPIDLALGWGGMSIASVINELKISQGGRFYEYSYKEPPLDQHQIETHSANTHCMPANDEVRRALLDVKRHELVTMEGYLVEVTGDDGFHWLSSLTREDTGGGACELMWITHLTHRKI
ncbi:MAG: hypothetical protein ABI222_18310 [Opitutaceae bacterium]